VTLQQIWDFIAVAQHGSLHAAARMTGQAQPAISKSLRRLEESLGAPLFVRGAKGIRLTPYGERFLGHARLITSESERAKAGVAELLGNKLSVVRYGVSPMSSVLLAPGAVTGFRRKHPDAELHSSSGLFHTLAPMLREGQIDFAVCPAPDQPAPDLSQVELVRCQVCVVARPGHPLARATSLEQLVDSTFVVGAPQGVAGAGVRGAFARLNLPPPKVDVYLDSMIDTLAFVSSTDRLALLPSLLMDTPLLRGDLTVLPIREALTDFQTSLIYRRDTPLASAAGTLSAMFEREASYLVSARRKAAAGR